MATIQSLDGQTLEELAKWIGKDHTSSQLQPFFKRAGLDVPPHDGSTKWRWVLNLLEQLNDRPGAIERVVLRLVNPQQYPGRPGDLTEALRRMNDLLAPEGVAVYLHGVQPDIHEIEPYIPNANEDPDIEFVPAEPPRFSEFVEMPQLQDILVQRWTEAQHCVQSGNYLSAIIMMGSILEASLLSVALKERRLANQSNAAPKNNRAEVKPVHDWSLSELINVALDCGWLGADAKDFSHGLRDYRNLIHPWHQVQKHNFSPDEDTCAICWNVLVAATNDLVRAFGNVDRE